MLEVPKFFKNYETIDQGVPKGHWKRAKRKPRCINKSWPKKGDINKREMLLEMSTCRRHLADLVCHFGAHWISKGRSARCFSMYLAQTQKLGKSFNVCTAKIGEYKTTKNMKRTKVQSTWRFCISSGFTTTQKVKRWRSYEICAIPCMVSYAILIWQLACTIS